jgi:hypothetical protein
MKIIVKLIVLTVILTVIFGFIFRMYNRPTGSEYYLVTAVNREPIITKFVIEKGDCVTFKDAFGNQHKICGTYEIEKF